LTGDGSLNCHGYGSVVSVTATFGQCAAGWILDALSKHKIRKDAKNPL
jgi:tRNA A37 threonylcarbamoyladenosine dehydratase